jgi:hypothetical protein
MVCTVTNSLPGTSLAVAAACYRGRFDFKWDVLYVLNRMLGGSESRRSGRNSVENKKKSGNLTISIRLKYFTTDFSIILPQKHIY